MDGGPSISKASMVFLLLLLYFTFSSPLNTSEKKKTASRRLNVALTEYSFHIFKECERFFSPLFSMLFS